MQTKGINHLALVCRDMAETVKFYTEVAAPEDFRGPDFLDIGRRT